MRLTDTCLYGGCAAKVGAEQLSSLLRAIGCERGPQVDIGVPEADDAAVVTLPDGQQLVQTVDFITPLVDDPYTYGQIAAANALGDIYAMGALPWTSLVVAVLSPEFSDDVYHAAFAGLSQKSNEAGASIIGGHTILDKTIKIGLAVTGLLSGHPFTINRARAGNHIYLTKPLGTGIYVNGLKSGKLTWDDAQQGIASMVSLNRDAALCARGAGVQAATDVTGFGLIGHVCNVANHSDVTVELAVQALPIFNYVEDLVAQGCETSGATRNRRAFSQSVQAVGDVISWLESTCYDPQTSGGLLLFSAVDLPYTRIGRVVPRTGVSVLLQY